MGGLRETASETALKASETALAAHRAEEERKAREDEAQRRGEQEEARRKGEAVLEMITRTKLPIWLPGVEWAVMRLDVNGADGVIAPPERDFMLGVEQFRPYEHDGVWKFPTQTRRGQFHPNWVDVQVDERGHIGEPPLSCDCERKGGNHRHHIEPPFTCAACGCDYYAVTNILVGSIETDTETHYPYWSGGPARELADIGRMIQGQRARAAEAERERPL